MALERDYQPKVIARLREMFPGCVIQKLDSGYQQGIPDLLFLWGPHWAILETKKSFEDRRNPQPNQEYFIRLFNEMSFAAFIYPEVEEEVFHAMEQAFRS